MAARARLRGKNAAACPLKGPRFCNGGGPSADRFGMDLCGGGGLRTYFPLFEGLPKGFLLVSLPLPPKRSRFKFFASARLPPLFLDSKVSSRGKKNLSSEFSDLFDFWATISGHAFWRNRTRFAPGRTSPPPFLRSPGVLGANFAVLAPGPLPPHAGKKGLGEQEFSTRRLGNKPSKQAKARPMGLPSRKTAPLFCGRAFCPPFSSAGPVFSANGAPTAGPREQKGAGAKGGQSPPRKKPKGRRHPTSGSNIRHSEPEVHTAPTRIQPEREHSEPTPFFPIGYQTPRLS